MQNQFLTTQEAADFLRIKPATLRHALCQKGNYCGVVPNKVNGSRLLLWKRSDIEALTNQNGGNAKGITK